MSKELSINTTKAINKYFMYHFTKKDVLKIGLHGFLMSIIPYKYIRNACNVLSEINEWQQDK